MTDAYQTTGRVCAAALLRHARRVLGHTVLAMRVGALVFRFKDAHTQMAGTLPSERARPLSRLLAAVDQRLTVLLSTTMSLVYFAMQNQIRAVVLKLAHSAQR